jgi:hypothetical protein
LSLVVITGAHRKEKFTQKYQENDIIRLSGNPVIHCCCRGSGAGGPVQSAARAQI